MSIFRYKLKFSSSLSCILICQLIILKLSFATSVDSIVKNGQPVASSSLSETLEFSDSIPGFEHHEFQSMRIKPSSNADKLTTTSNRSTIAKVTTSSTLVATLLKKVGLPAEQQHQSTPKYAGHHNSNKTILNSVLIKRINRPTAATLISSSNLLLTTTPIPNDAASFDDSEIFKRHGKLASSSNGGKLLRLSKKKKAKQATYKSLNSSSPHFISSVTSTPATVTSDAIENNELISSSLAPSGLQATEQHVHYNTMINHGGGAISTIRRTLNGASQPSIEHLQIGFPPSNSPFPNDPFPNFPSLNGLDFTPPPIPQPIGELNNQPPPPPPPSQSPPKLQREEQPPAITKPPTIYSSSNRNNGRLRGAHKKQAHVNRRKSAALLKDNELNNQIVPVSVGLPNSFQNMKPQDLPNFAELSFFGYRSGDRRDEDTPRSFNERERYSTNGNSNNNNNNNNFNDHHYNLPPAIVTQPPPPASSGNNNNNNQQPQNSAPRLNGPSNEFNFNLRPFFSNERRNQPNNNDLYQFFDSPFMPISPPNIQSINTFSNIHHGDNNHQLNHHHQINHHIYHQPIDNEINNGPPLHPVNTPNGQFFQRRKLTLSNGNTAPPLNEISNNLGYGYPSYNVYKSDEEAGIKWPKIFKFTDGRVNLNDFEKEKKLGKIEFGKSVAEDGNEYTFEHVRRDLFLILHGGSFSY